MLPKKHLCGKEKLETKMKGRANKITTSGS
jgi:hypothetical protein